MSSRCLSCLQIVDGLGERHSACTRDLFGTTTEPAIDLELARLHTYGLAMVGRTALSGAQRKISVALSGDRSTLRVALAGSQFILKPQAATFPYLPENEHVTMLLAKAAGIPVPAFGLVRLADGSLAYLVRRFDRTPDGAKIRMEDFCQLAEQSPKDKYRGSAELLFRLTHRYASEPLIAAARLFRQLVFAWWTGNGDLHVKNVALLADGPRHGLSPAFDLLCTRLVIEDDDLALSVGGKRNRLRRADLVALGDYARLPRRASERTLRELAAHLDDSLELVRRSYLPPELREIYLTLLTDRATELRPPEVAQLQ